MHCNELSWYFCHLSIFVNWYWSIITQSNTTELNCEVLANTQPTTNCCLRRRKITVVQVSQPFIKEHFLCAPQVERLLSCLRFCLWRWSPHTLSAAAAAREAHTLHPIYHLNCFHFHIPMYFLTLQINLHLTANCLSLTSSSPARQPAVHTGFCQRATSPQPNLSLNPSIPPCRLD